MCIQRGTSPTMILLKSVAAGVVGGLMAAVVWVLSVLFVQLWLPMLIARPHGTGGFGAVSVDSGTVLIAAFGGFIGAFVWQFRRLR